MPCPTSAARGRGWAAPCSRCCCSAPRLRPRAQEPDRPAWFRRIIGQDQGLPETQVNAIAQTPDGYLWLGTRRGLVRYDGLAFTPFQPAAPAALPSQWINGLNLDRHGRLWVSTSRGLAVLEADTLRRIPEGRFPPRRSGRSSKTVRARLGGHGGRRVRGRRYPIPCGAGGHGTAVRAARGCTRPGVDRGRGQLRVTRGGGGFGHRHPAGRGERVRPGG
ncbi:MAG: hypothetical protein IPF77_11075 [Gemmatimonadetes bacterium]|nr:hypothetical protein [Gemmatimonadota bacterium]